MSGAVKKRYRLWTVLNPQRMPTKVASAKQAELNRRQAERDARPPKPGSAK
jgi:hypothetical protein